MISPPPPPPLSSLADRLNAALPQTQCTRCGYPDCRAYAQAMAQGQADINRCPPGGAEGIQRLAFLTGRAAPPLDTSHGVEGPRGLAVIDEAWCIGCTLCIKACPVDCIVGAPKLMHTVIDQLCTGCELCVPVCPVDCIAIVPVTDQRTGWAAWSSPQAQEARARYADHGQRVQRDERENSERLAAKAQARRAALVGHSRTNEIEIETDAETAALATKQAVVEAALARARARQKVP